MKDNNWFWIVGIILVVGILIYSQKGSSIDNKSCTNVNNNEPDTSSLDRFNDIKKDSGEIQIQRFPMNIFDYTINSCSEYIDFIKPNFNKDVEKRIIRSKIIYTDDETFVFCNKKDDILITILGDKKFEEYLNTFIPCEVNNDYISESNTNSIFSIFSSYNDRFPNQIFFEKNFKLSEQGNLVLSDGMKAENVKKIEISITGCGEDSGDVYLGNEKLGSYSFSQCNSLNYPDGTGSSYIHYQTKTFTKLFYDTPTSPKLTTNTLSYRFTRNDKDITKREAMVYEKVECISDSQCITVAPSCSQTYHRCIPKVTSCTMEYAPVCGVNGISYANPCFISLIGTSISHNGLCEGDAQTDVKDENNNTIDMSDLTYPIADTSNTPMFFWIGVFIIIVIFIYLQRKK